VFPTHDGRPASGSAIRRPMPRRSAAEPGHGWRRSGSCSSVRPPCWPSGCVTLAVPRRSRACSASPTSCARRSARAGPEGSAVQHVTAIHSGTLTGGSWCPLAGPEPRRWGGTLVEFGNGRGQMMLQVLSLVSRGKGA
jgi:hypothetical protein